MIVDAERLWYGVPIPLAKLAELDDCPSSIGLADAVGDRYLCAHNPVFAGVRRTALAFGFRFSTDDTPLWRDYLALGLTTLHQILATRTIPYHSTGTTLRRLLDANPRAALSPGFITGNLKANHAFHEAAHCVAHSVVQAHEASLAAASPDERERFVISAAIEESFANTAERLGTLVTHQPMFDQVFFRLNSHIIAKTATTAVLQRAGDELGGRLRFGLLFASSLEANLTVDAPTDLTFERIASAVECPDVSRDLARQVMEIGFDISDGFRQYTNPVYFEMLGYQREYAAVAARAWLAEPQGGVLVRDLIDPLFAIVSARHQDERSVPSDLSR